MSLEKSIVLIKTTRIIPVTTANIPTLKIMMI